MAISRKEMFYGLKWLLYILTASRLKINCVDVGSVAKIYVERLMGLNASSESEGAADQLSHWLIVHLQTMIVLQSLLVTQKRPKRKIQRLQMKIQRKMKTRTDRKSVV